MLAGAHLVVPDMDELLALSDREARRQFAAQAAAFAAYRNRGQGGQLASSAPMVTESTATQGQVSSEPAAPAAQQAGQGDHLRLSGAAPAGSGGTSSVALSGASGQTGTAGGQASGSAAGGAGASNQAGAAGAPRRAAAAGHTAGQTSAGGQSGTASRADAEAQADLRTAQGKAIADAQSRVSQLEENVGHISEALKAQGEAARTAVMEGAKGLGESISTVASAVSQASQDAAAEADDSSAALTGSRGAAPGGQAGPGAAGASTPAGNHAADPATTGTAAETPASRASIEALTQPTAEAEKTVPWIQDHLVSVIVALLALIVLFIVWLLKRASRAREDIRGGAQITEAMVRERLSKIDLELTSEPGKSGAANKATE